MQLGLNCVEAIGLKQTDRRAVFAAIAALGVSTIRVEIPWKAVNLERTTIDNAMADAQKANLDVLAMVAHPPSPQPSATSFGTLMKGLAQRYPQVTHWEIWNEENLQAFFPKGNPENFTPYLQAAYTGIKAVNPQTQVVFGGLAACATHSGFNLWPPTFYTNTDPVEFLTRAYAAGAGGHFDILGLHPYCIDAGFRWLTFTTTDPYVAAINTARVVMQGKGDGNKPIWATEYGFPISSFTAAQQAQNLQAQTAFLQTQVDRAYLFAYRDNAGGEYGLVDKNNVARPSLAWFQGVPKT